MQGSLRSLLFVNVRQGAHPADNFFVVITNGQGTAQGPTIYARHVLQAKLRFKVITMLKAVAPGFAHPGLVIRMNKVEPTLAIQGGFIRTGKAKPLLVDVILLSIRQR